MMPDCGGCQGLGSHKRWCPQRVGHDASILGPASEVLEEMGDRVGASDPGRANMLYRQAAVLYGLAEQAATKPHTGER